MSFRDLYHKWARLNKLKMEESLMEYKNLSSEVNFIQFIGKNENSNVTRLAESFYMTSGAISKLSKKLLEKGVVGSDPTPENKKEIYFRLTERGRVVYFINEELHKEF